MGLGDLFKAKQNDELRAKVAQLESMLTPEMQDSVALQDSITAQRSELASLQKETEALASKREKETAKYENRLHDLESKIESAKKDLVETEESVLMQSFALYKPHYSFANSTGYKEALDRIRTKQKELIKSGSAVTGSKSWSVNGDLKKGAKMVSDMQKLLLRAFNLECDDVIDRVKFNNIEAAEKRIQSSFSSISKLGTICDVAITGKYRDLKIEELHLAHEYQVEKQNEKEHLKQIRAEERERAKLEKEIEEARKKIEKEEKHYTNALRNIDKQIKSADPADVPALLEKKAEMEGRIAELNASREEIDYRVANQKAGYVYIISNIGAFGEGVYKIGMTRRLDPMDRVDELGDASVPFDFDVHALIFSDDAPALEAALHRAFEDRKLNMVNTRREFFRVSLDEIKAVVKKNFDKTVEFIDVPPAEQYRMSLQMHHN